MLWVYPRKKCSIYALSHLIHILKINIQFKLNALCIFKFCFNFVHTDIQLHKRKSEFLRNRKCRSIVVMKYIDSNRSLNLISNKLSNLQKSPDGFLYYKWSIGFF